jgi:O-antigen/teichoic acid export membrane protein
MSVRFGLTAMDQCVSSLSNFVVGVAVARVVGVAGFGAYALVYSVWLVVAAFHRSLITDPMSIENDMHKTDHSRHVRVGLAAELWLGFVAAVLFAAAGAALLSLGQLQFGICFVVLAPWLPFLLAQDYWRWVSFMKRKPQKALANDFMFFAVQIAVFVALVVVGFHSSWVAIAAWGVGAAGGALFGLWQFSTRPTLEGGIERIRDRWGLSKWLAGVNAMASTSSQSTPVLTGVFLGPVGVGGLKSAASLVTGPSLVLIQAGGSIGLPEASKALKERGWPGLRRVQRFITAAGMLSVSLIAVIVFCFGRQLLDVVYGPAFGRFAGIADILAVGVFCASCGLGAILCLKATRQTQRLFVVSTISLIVSVVAVVILAPIFGVVGAAVATLLGNAASSLGLLIAHWTSTRRVAESMGSPRDPAADRGAFHAWSASDGDGAVAESTSNRNLVWTWIDATPPGQRKFLPIGVDQGSPGGEAQEASIE